MKLLKNNSSVIVAFSLGVCLPAILSLSPGVARNPPNLGSETEVCLSTVADSVLPVFDETVVFAYEKDIQPGQRRSQTCREDALSGSVFGPLDLSGNRLLSNAFVPAGFVSPSVFTIPLRV